MIKIKINSWSHTDLDSPVLINILSLLQLISSLHNNNYYLVLLSLLHLASSFVFFFGNFVAGYFCASTVAVSVCATRHFPHSDIPRHFQLRLEVPGA